MAQLQSIGFRVFCYVYGFFGALMVLMGILVGVITKGPKKVFSKTPRRERPEILDNPEYGTHHFVRLKTITLHYVENGPSNKPLMLFLHGFPEFWFSWRNQLKHFSKNYRAVAVDMRGYGESGKPKGVANYHGEILAADIRDFVHALGYEKCILVGHDWGGGVAWRTAMNHPDLIDRLVICNCPHPVAMEKGRSMTQLRKSWYMFFFQLPYLPEIMLGLNDIGMFDDAFVTKSKRPSNEEIEAYKHTYRPFESREAPVNYYRAVFRYVSNTRGPICAPTLIIWGTGDLFLGKELAQLSADCVGEHATVKYIEGANHFVQYDEPEKVNECIENFLAGQ